MLYVVRFRNGNTNVAKKIDNASDGATKRRLFEGRSAVLVA
jgi:hypothetical protein